MAIVTQEFYTDVYYGETIAAADFPRYDARAEDLILGLIKRSEQCVLTLPEPVLVLVKKAICVQIEYLYEYGPGVAVYGREGGGGFTVGKVSVTEGGGSGGAASGAGSIIAPGVYVYLERTGLLYPGVPVAGMPPQAWGWWP